MMVYPRIFRVRQRFDQPQVLDVPAEVECQLTQIALGERINPGQTVAVAAGSRGIANIHLVVKAVVDHVKQLGAEPFIVPAMGSHAGGKADGQKAILESYGITEAFCGCPIRATMDTVIVCEAAEGFPVHFDQYAFEADHVIVCNRIKTHTQFTGPIESGVLKMMLIGLGKHAGAQIYHRAISDFSFAQILNRVTAEVIDKCSIAAGVGIVENAHGQTAKIEAMPAHEIEQREKTLLVQAKAWSPRLPFDTAHILLIDQTGKNISGTGFDLSVTGRKTLIHRPADDESPKIKMICLRDLTDATKGNAEGMGLAEFCRTRLLDKTNLDITRINGLTSGHIAGSMIPHAYPTDRKLLDVMLTQIGLAEPPDAGLMWIRNTVQVAEVECSEVYLDKARQRDDLEILTDVRPFEFNAEGNLSDKHMDA